jgi:hypothetical protein
MRKRIKLVIQLFKEAGRAINSMPLLLLEPLLVIDHNLILLIYCKVLPKEYLLGEMRKTMKIPAGDSHKWNALSLLYTSF